MKKSKFITVEGIDGAGKSSYIETIKKFLESQGETVVLTREPGGTSLGKSIREMALNEPMDATTETLLMFADRSEHVKKVIEPALENGSWVICDRFTDSTYAYQHGAKNVPKEYIEQLTNMVVPNLQPSLTLVFDVPLEVSRQRLQKTGKEPDKFERENEDFFNKVRDTYLNVCTTINPNIKIIDATPSFENVVKSVEKTLDEFYANPLNYSNKAVRLRT